MTVFANKNDFAFHKSLLSLRSLRSLSSLCPFVPSSCIIKAPTRIHFVRFNNSGADQILVFRGYIFFRLIEPGLHFFQKVRQLVSASGAQ